MDKHFICLQIQRQLRLDKFKIFNGLFFLQSISSHVTRLRLLSLQYRLLLLLKIYLNLFFRHVFCRLWHFFVHWILLSPLFWWLDALRIVSLNCSVVRLYCMNHVGVLDIVFAFFINQFLSHHVFDCNCIRGIV